MRKKKGEIVPIENAVAFFPQSTTLTKEEEEESLKKSLPKGQYDINYVIKLCEMIESKCEVMKLSPSDLCFSLQHSLKSLRISLIMERDFTTHGPKTYRCETCNEMYFILPNDPNAFCPHCKDRTKKIENKSSF